MARAESSAFRKGVVYAAVTLALLALAFLFIGDRTLLAIGKNLEARGRTEASTATFQTLLNLFPDSEYAAEGLLHMAKSTPPVRPEKYMPGSTLVNVPGLPGMVYFIKNRATSWQGPRDERAPEKIAYLERLLEEYPDSKWRIGAVAELGFTMSALGKYEEAARLLQQAWDHPDYSASDPELGIYLAQAYLNIGDIDSALETLIEAGDKANGSQDLLYSIALAFENLGAYDRAYEIVTSHSAMADVRSRLERTYDQLADNGEPPALTGKVTMNGQSIAGVRVILVRGEFGSPGSPPVAQAVTDAAGSFNLYRIPTGTYQVALALPAQMARESIVYFEPALDTLEVPTIEIKEGETAEVAINFERSPLFTHAQVIDQEPFPVLELAWEEDPRAVAYRVGLIQKARPSLNAEVTGHTVLEDINAWTFESPEARISLEELYLHSMDSPHAPDRAEAEIDLTALLGFRHPDVSAHFYVAPIDADGRMLGNWQGEWDGFSEARRNLATVELPSRRTTADELLLQRDYEAAIAAYQERLEQDPNELHSLYVLWALYTFGTDSSGSHQNLTLGKQYGERLLEFMTNPTVRGWVERSIER